MSQPNTTSQKPNPPSTADSNLSLCRYLPRKTPSMSVTATLTLPLAEACTFFSALRAPSLAGPDLDLLAIGLSSAWRASLTQLSQMSTHAAGSRGHLPYNPRNQQSKSIHADLRLQVFRLRSRNGSAAENLRRAAHRVPALRAFVAGQAGDGCRVPAERQRLVRHRLQGQARGEEAGRQGRDQDGRRR